MMKKISIIIPAFNASESLDLHLPDFIAYLHKKKITFEIIIVDDGSRDQNKSRFVAKKLHCTFVSYSRNKGKGYALRLGMKQATGKFLLFTDADIPFSFDTVPQMLHYLDFKEFDMVVGDRTLPKSNYYRQIPLIRSVGSSLFSFIAGRFISGGYFDTQCGVKGFRAETGKELFSKSTINRFAIDVELIYLALKQNLDIKRIPVQLRSNNTSSVRVVKDGTRMLFDLFSIPLKNWVGIYTKDKTIELKNKDKIQIEGSYQYNALYNGNPIQRFWHFTKYEQTKKLLNIRKKSTVLDVGCGSGVLSFMLAKDEPTARIVGVDSNKQAILFCKKAYRLPNLSFKQNFVDCLPFKPNSVDGIIFLEVIEHIYPKQAENVLKQFHKLLKKNGKLIISTPNYASFWPVIEVFLDRFHLVAHLKDDQHVVKYSDRKLIEIVNNNGFQMKKKYSINLIAPFVNTISNTLAKFIHSIEVSREHAFGNVLVFEFRKK